ncbi:hypothetical protein ACYZT4_17625 [Pseudomonas sp. GB2N2]
MLIRSEYSRYSRFFYTEYEQSGPFIDEEHCGYSILQAIQWQTVDGKPLMVRSIQRMGVAWCALSEPNFLLWLEDGLARGILAPVLFACARSGSVTLVVDATSDLVRTEQFKREWDDVFGVAEDPYWWNVSFECFDRDRFQVEMMPVITDEYVRNINHHWKLGMRRYESAGLVSPGDVRPNYFVP